MKGIHSAKHPIMRPPFYPSIQPLNSYSLPISLIKPIIDLFSSPLHLLLIQPFIYSFVHTYIHIHLYIHVYIHTYLYGILTYNSPYVHSFVNTFINSSPRSLSSSCDASSLCHYISFTHSSRHNQWHSWSCWRTWWVITTLFLTATRNFKKNTIICWIYFYLSYCSNIHGTLKIIFFD
jgi:hypothetical protein